MHVKGHSGAIFNKLLMSDTKMEINITINIFVVPASISTLFEAFSPAAPRHHVQTKKPVRTSAECDTLASRSPSLMLLLPCRAVSLLLLLLLPVCQVPVHAFTPSVRIPSLASGPYLPNQLVEVAVFAQSTLRISSPVQLIGDLSFAVAPFGGGAFQLPNGATTNELQMQIQIPHSQDDPYGCNALMHPVTDDGTLLAGTMLLLERRGGCDFQAKVDAALAIGAAAVAVYNCDVCEAGLVRPAAFTSSLPFIFMQMEDGFLIRDYISSRRQWLLSNQTIPNNYTQAVYGNVTGTGPINATELVALRSIASAITMTESLVTAASALPLWSSLLSPSSTDPCVDRLVGVWCEGGSITSVFLQYFGISGSLHPAWGELKQLRYLTIAENTPQAQGHSTEWRNQALIQIEADESCVCVCVLKQV